MPLTAAALAPRSHRVGAYDVGHDQRAENDHTRSRQPQLPGDSVWPFGTEQTLVDAGGFIDIGDLVERRGDRYYFAGRKDGVINIGALKVHPEEIEQIINQHPQVSLSLVRAKQTPIIGSILVADVTLKSEQQVTAEQQMELKENILIPAVNRFLFTKFLQQ
jgi:acyl-coenzyme A synthetase/AMP-(fatty) acid ligase